MGKLEDTKLEAVYYSAPFPRSRATITLLGLIFDRVHFPGVILATKNFTDDDIDARLEHLNELFEKDMAGGSSRAGHVAEMVRGLQLSRWNKWTNEFLHFDADSYGLENEPEVRSLVSEIHNQTFGPPRAGFEPFFETTNSFSVLPVEAGSERERDGTAIRYPGAFHYPASALIYATRKGLPLLNDVPQLAIPSMPLSFKENASGLASLLAVQCLECVMPKVPDLDIFELLDFRDEVRPYTRSFRNSLFRLARDLNAMISSSSDQADIERQAAFLIETDIRPNLLELIDFAESPLRPWYTNPAQALGFSSKVAGAYFSGFSGAAVTQLLLNSGVMFADDYVSSKAKDRALKRSPLYYLLRISKLSPD